MTEPGNLPTWTDTEDFDLTQPQISILRYGVSKESGLQGERERERERFH